MDLTVDQIARLKEFIGQWANNPRFELEATFGQGGVVDSTTFLQIAQRLRAKGFKAIAQEDRLNILTPKQIRFTLEGVGILQAYCKDDTLDNKSFSAMLKDHAFPNSNLDVEEYALRVKVRREEELSDTDPRITEILKQWKRQRKAFRLIRRWSFEGKGIRMDLSMVRQTPSLPGRGDYQWSTTFLEKNVLQELPRYEVEVELLRDAEHTATPALALKALVSGIGEVLRAIQKNSLLLRLSQADAVRREYKALVRGDKFRGVGPVTLETKNMTREKQDGVYSIRSGYNVTDKADGLRAMGYVSSTGELYLVDQSLNIYRTGLQNKKCKESLVDGEWVTQTKDGAAIHHFLLFDIYYAPDGKEVSSLPFITFVSGSRDLEGVSRFNALKAWYAHWAMNTEVVAKGVTEGNRLLIAIKEFYFAPPGDTLFAMGCSAALDAPRIYHTDGLILTSNDAPLPDGIGVRFEQQFKWKPAKDNTVDFLVSIEKDMDVPTIDRIQTTVMEASGELIQYKTMRLYVGGKKSKEETNPRDTILRQLPIAREPEGPVRYRPVLFHPVDYPDTMANTCYVPITRDEETYEEYAMTEDSKEPIRHNSIVEMRYDPRREPGWRWIPSRIRHDKTERLQRAIADAKDKPIKYSGTMNDEGVANSVWNSIHDPVTETMIRTGQEEPTEEELRAMMPAESKEDDVERMMRERGDKYYERKAPKENLALIKGLQDFHNKYIKNELLLKRALLGFNKTVVDLACGKAGDLYKWINNNARRVIGVDMAADNITNPTDGAYRRYMDVLREGRQRNPPKMAFIVGNSSKSLVDGSAGGTDEDRDMLRTIFGRAEPAGPVPPYINKEFGGVLREGADVAACMFALHYFFENKTVLDGFLENLSTCVKVGGYFIGCCFDGQKVFHMLEGVERGQSRTGTEKDVPIWSITKEYDADHLSDDDFSIGMGVDVNFISIGMVHREYLVPFELLKRKLSAIGFRLLYPEELTELDLENSTNTFDASFQMLHRGAGGVPLKPKYYMPDAVKQFSFLNRWFIFKRAGVTEATISPALASAEVGAVGAVNQHFGIDLTRYNKSYALFSIVSSSPYSVLKPWEKTQVNKTLRKWFPVPDSIKRAVDATAHIGVDTINFSNQFPRALIDAYEIVPETYEALVKNIAKFKKEDRIRPHNEDISLWEPSHLIDFLYVDPPWGGPSYAEVEKLDLYLQKESNAHNENKNVNALIDKWFQSGKIRNILLKAPKNFNSEHLTSRYTLQKENVLNRKKEIAYVLYRIQTPVIQTDALESVEEEKQEQEQQEKQEKQEKEEKEEVKAISAASRLGDPNRAFKASDLFLFGPSVALSDTLKGGARKEHSGRWLSLSAPFPIPDRDLKTENGQAIVYPTMEHYLAAMKYQHASNHPEMVIGLFSTMGNIHQRNLIKRRVKKTPLGSETPDDYKMLEVEIKEVKETMAGPFMERNRVIIDEGKWNRPMTPEDPLSLGDRILRDALAYRWERDADFRKIVDLARTQNKYMVYTIGPDSDSSELAAKYMVEGVWKGMIRGGNKVGNYIMDIAGFTF